MDSDLGVRSVPQSNGFNPFVAPHRENPFPFFSWSRAQAPVTYVPDPGVWLVTRYGDVVSVLSDPARFSSTMSIPDIDRDNPPEVLRILSRTLPTGFGAVQVDPPQHAPLRAVWRRLMRVSRIKAIQPRAREIAEELVASFAADGHADLVEQFCKPFVQRVLGTFVGNPPADTPRVASWNEDFIALLTPAGGGADKQDAAARFVDYNNYLLELIDQRRRDPREDLISELVHHPAASSGQYLDTVGMLNIIRSAYAAGTNTPIDAIGNAVLNLLAEGHWQRAGTDPAVIPALVEETLRRDSPHRGLMRVTTTDTELAGVHLPAEALVLPLLSSANRDETQFEAPDAFRPERPGMRRHVAFGHGIHLCIGAQLARVECRVALAVLTQRLPTLRLAEQFEPTHYPAWFFWGLETLHVTWNT